MSLEEKRNHYECSEPVVLAELRSWQDFASSAKFPPMILEPVFNFDEDLNEKVSIWGGDITTLEIDIIVNAANTHLYRSTGVCKAIFSSASSALDEECECLKRCEPGHAVMTGGYKLPAKYILHAVGPYDRDPEVLKSCYKECLAYLTKKKEPMPDLRSIAFPCISTGKNGFPTYTAARIAVSTAREFLEDHRDMVDRIIFCIFTAEDMDVYRHWMQVYFPLD